MSMNIINRMYTTEKMLSSCVRSRSLLLFGRGRLLSTSSNGEQDLYDMVVVGGGMVGLAMTNAIGQSSSVSSKRILLVESSVTPPPETTPTQPYSKRVCTLSQGSVQLLQRLGVWSSIQAVRCKGFKSIHVWDACTDVPISFSPEDLTSFDIPNETIQSLGSHDHHVTDEATPTDNEMMGYIVENDVIIKALDDRLGNYGNVEVKRGVALSDVSSWQPDDQGGRVPNPWLQLKLTNGDLITTRLLVGADGTRSHVRHMTGLHTVGWSYNQSAVVATLGLEQGFSDNLVAWQRFLPSGPIALLPLSDTHSSLVWSTTTDHAKNLLQMEEGQFVDALNTALFEEFPRSSLVETANSIARSLIGSISSGLVAQRRYPPSVASVHPSSRGMFPLSCTHVPNYVKPRVVLIGDSAHQLHPLAGLGVNMGLGDVACLYQSLVKANDVGEEWGFLPRLLWYETTRQRQNLPVMGVVDGLQRMFSTSLPPVTLVRSLGLQLTNALPPLKELIYSKAQNT